MLKNVGTQIRRVFFITGPNARTNFFQGAVRSVNAAHKYYVVYDDYVKEEIGEAEFEIYKMKVKDQLVVKFDNVQSARFWKDANDGNFASGHCHHSCSKDTHKWIQPKRRGGSICSRFLGRISGRHRQVLLHLMFISMRLSALHT